MIRLPPKDLPRRRGLAALWLAFLAAVVAGPAVANAASEKGEINGAPFEIALPAVWNQSVLILAHGYRPAEAPPDPELHPERPFVRALLDEGWIVAATGYRRSGMVVGDGMEDIDALQARIEKLHENPVRTVLFGEGMGGLIVTKMAEREPGTYSGAVAVSPSLSAQENGTPGGLSLVPKIPLLFVANSQELSGPKSYIQARFEKPKDFVPAVLFLINRSGRGNLSSGERLEVFKALLAWISSDQSALPRPAEGAPFFDATLSAEAGPSQVRFHEGDSGFDCQVIEGSPAMAPLVIEAGAGDFQKAGIGMRMFFRLRGRDLDLRVMRGRDIDSVKRGEWVAYADPEGRTIVARNFGEPTGPSALSPGDTVSILAYGAP